VPEEVVLLLGSNTGRRVRRLRDAIAALAGEVAVGEVSRIHAGEPSGRTNQPWYLNVAVRGETGLAPEASFVSSRGSRGRRVERRGRDGGRGSSTSTSS